MGAKNPTRDGKKSKGGQAGRAGWEGGRGQNGKGGGQVSGERGETERESERE